MAPEMSSGMMITSPCELGDGELPPTRAGSHSPASRTGAGIPAADADASVYDFFDGVAAHQTEQFLKDQHTSRVVPMQSPDLSAYPLVPLTESRFGAVQEAVGSHENHSSTNQMETEAACLPESSIPNWDNRREVAEEGSGAPQGSNSPLSEQRTAIGAANPQEVQGHIGDEMHPRGTKCLVPPSRGLVGNLHPQPQLEEQQHQQLEKTRTKDVLPLNLQRAHQQRMQTLDIQRGTETLDDSLNIGPNDDLLQHLHRLSTKIRAQEDEKRLMAEESFQLEQILKRQYHADIREKTEQNNQLLRSNESLKQEVERLSGECEGLRGALSVLDEVLEGFFDRQKRYSKTRQPEEECFSVSNPDEALCANMKTLFAALDEALTAESATLDQETEKELQQRLEAASALCRAATAGAAAAASLSPTSWSRGSDALSASIPRPSFSFGNCPTLGDPAATGEGTVGVASGEDNSKDQPLKPLGTPPGSSEAQLEMLKAQIERLRENLGAFTEGVLHAHKKHLRQYKLAGNTKVDTPPENMGATKALGDPVSDSSPKNLAAAKVAHEREAPCCRATLEGVIPSAAMEKAHLVVDAKQPLQPSEAWPIGNPPKSKEKARALWRNSAVVGIPAGGRAGPQQQPVHQFLLGEPVRGALLLPSDHHQHHHHQQQRLRCSPCSSGSPFDACCEAPPLVAPQGPPKPGIVLPPLRQRQRQGSRGPCARRRGPSWSSASHVEAAGRGLTVSASAVSLLPALKSGSTATVSPASKGLVNSASAVDLSVIGRSLVAPLAPPSRPLPLFNGPPHGVYSHPPGKASFAPSGHKQPSVSPTAGDRGRLGATARSNSTSSSGRVFSRTRRSCSPIKERPRVGTFCFGGRTSSGRVGALPGVPSHRHMTADTLSLESKVNASNGHTSSGTNLAAKEEWRKAYRPRSLGGLQCSAVNPYFVATPSRELSPAAMPAGDGRKGASGKVSYHGKTWQESNTRLVASAANQEAVAAAVASAGLVSPSHGLYMHAYSQPPRAGGPMASGVHLKPSLLQQQQDRNRQPSPYGFTPASPAASATAAGCGGYFPSPVSACSPVNYSFISPTSRRAPTLSTTSASHGGPRRGPTPAAVRGVHCGGFRLLSPMCYSNPPTKSPSSIQRSSSNVHTIQKQRHKDDDVGEWMHARP